MAKEKEKPFTRNDLLWAIEKNGGTAEGLKFSRCKFEEGIDLRNLNLQGINLKEAKMLGAQLQGAKLIRAQLQKALLSSAQLQGAYLDGAELKGASLIGAQLQGARLMGTQLQGAHFAVANLEGASLFRAGFSPSTELERVNWGNYVLGDEEKTGNPIIATKVYRKLKIWYTDAGLYDIAGQFFFREMTARRKALGWWPNPLPRIRQTLYWLLCGYGEKPWQVFASAAAVVLGLGLIYFAIGTLEPRTFLNSFYYSAVSFTALGYGSWAPQPTGWVKGLGAVEAFVGVFMMALFLVTFIRKMTR